QSDDLAMHHIGKHRPKPLALPALNLIEADVPGLAFRACAVPFGEKGGLGASGFAPAHTMSHGGVTRGHRLTVDADLLTQPSRDARLRIGKLDPLGANPTSPTHHPPPTQHSRPPSPA